MDRIQDLNNKINKITLKIEQEYPELYQFLDESPITLSLDVNPTIDENILSEYLDSLTQLLHHYKTSHQINK